MKEFFSPGLVKQFTKPPYFVNPPEFDKIQQQYLKRSWGLIEGTTDFILLFFASLYLFFRFMGSLMAFSPTLIINSVFLIILLIIAYNGACWLKKHIIVLLHSWLPGKVAREEEVLNYFWGLRREMVRVPGTPVEIEPKINPYIKEWTSTTPQEFCEKHFNKSGPGFISFFSERASKDQKLNNDFIFYALSIPKAKELSVDALRKVLLAYQELSLSEPLSLEKAFNNYSCREIEIIFSNPYNRSYLLTLEKRLNLPVAKDLYDLRDKLKEQTIPKELKGIHGREIDGLKFKVLRLRHEYEDTSVEFNNCIRTYWDRGEVIVTVHDKENTPIACVSIVKKQVFDLKSVSNSSCYEDGRIREILRQENII